MTSEELAEAVREMFDDGRRPSSADVLWIATSYGNFCRVKALEDIHRAVLDERERIKVEIYRHLTNSLINAIDRGERHDPQ